jgi:hypothetical protein
MVQTLQATSAEPHRERAFRWFAGIAALTAALLAFANLGLMYWAVGGRLDVVSDPLRLLGVGSTGANLWRWSMIADLFGYYLLLAPIILLLRSRRAGRTDDWSELYSMSLLAYCLIGAIGAAVLASSTPVLIERYAFGTPAGRAVLETVASTQADEIYRGLWNLLEVFVAAFGWIALGLDWRRSHPILAGLSLLAGTGALIDFGGSLFEVEALSLGGLGLYLVGAPLWAAWAGSAALRGSLSAA